jgi:hypothetical protein
MLSDWYAQSNAEFEGGNQRLETVLRVSKEHGAWLVLPDAPNLRLVFEENMALLADWLVQSGVTVVTLGSGLPAAASWSGSVFELGSFTQSDKLLDNTVLLQTESMRGMFGVKDSDKAKWQSALLVLDYWPNSARRIATWSPNVLAAPIMLMRIPPPPPQIMVKSVDVVCVGGYSPRRAAMLQLLTTEGLSVAWCHHMQSVEQNRQLMATARVWFNCHFYEQDTDTLELHRLVQAAGQPCAVVSEITADAKLMNIMAPAVQFFYSPDTLVTVCKHARDNWEELSKKANAWWSSQQVANILSAILKTAATPSRMLDVSEHNENKGPLKLGF